MNERGYSFRRWMAGRKEFGLILRTYKQKQRATDPKIAGAALRDSQRRTRIPFNNKTAAFGGHVA